MNLFIDFFGILNYDSFYVFMRDIIGYDLSAFFERNQDLLRNEVRIVLEKLLSIK